MKKILFKLRVWWQLAKMIFMVGINRHKVVKILKEYAGAEVPALYDIPLYVNSFLAVGMSISGDMLPAEMRAGAALYDVDNKFIVLSPEANEADTGTFIIYHEYGHIQMGHRNKDAMKRNLLAELEADMFSTSIVGLYEAKRCLSKMYKVMKNHAVLQQNDVVKAMVMAGADELLHRYELVSKLTEEDLAQFNNMERNDVLRIKLVHMLVGKVL